MDSSRCDPGKGSITIVFKLIVANDFTDCWQLALPADSAVWIIIDCRQMPNPIAFDFSRRC
jgi:hypothetical protein